LTSEELYIGELFGFPLASWIPDWVLENAKRTHKKQKKTFIFLVKGEGEIPPNKTKIFSKK
jgi:hypothetical protein